MSAALGTTKCATLGCRRKRAESADGRVVYSRCWFCTAAVLTGAFGPELEARVDRVPRLRFQPGVEQRPDAVPAA